MGLVFSNPDFDPVQEEYVHAYANDVDWKKAELTGLNDKVSRASMDRYLANLKQMNIQVYNAEDFKALGILTDFGEDNIIQIFNDAADQMNEKVEEELRSNFDKFLEGNNAARNNRMVFSSDTIDRNQFTKFMNGILDGLQAVSTMSAKKWSAFSLAYLRIAD
ncbi:MAG: hypothetical protein NC548_25765 [Lachnospiraceae bacterium]|nr:hypothetical protein [Lachnospiraceae bacterium]